ncbi:MAG: 1-acyl-sn-glycerol-3-phosphate acyltransferase [Proteobacteria bacterium]|nr:1-acyl-sn-glycerol-3-phosphate acyltransferase [Pseudomonadota bacterium]
MGTARAVFRLFLLAILTVVVVGTQTLLLPFYRGKYSYLMPIFWQWGTCKIFGVEVIVRSAPVKGRQIIYVSNHLSYLDIPALGSVVMGSFVARGDMSRWPLIGYMGKMQQTVYISRERQDAAAGKEAIEKVLRDGNSLMIFAEGTSSDGSKVLPFKSSLFSLALENPTGKPLPVQPITISLLEVNGKSAVTTEIRDQYAWHRDMTLPPHIWQFARFRRGAKVAITFHPVREAAGYSDRKALCNDCYNDVAGGLMLPEQLLALAA